MGALEGVAEPGVARNCAAVDQTGSSIIDAFFLRGESGERFCVLNAPPSGIPLRSTVVYLHPFAEEMNKSRRMAALQARRLAAEGFAVLHIDLHGCGDSSGDFAEARWESWIQDARAAVSWVSQRYKVPLMLWGLRLGATLAAEVAADASLGVDRLVLWQPITDGSQFLSHFLRLQLASDLLVTGAANTALRELTDALHRGEPTEIIGYELHPDLASAIERLKLDALTPAAKQVEWLEVLPAGALSLRPASRRVIDAWSAQGLRIHIGQAVGEPFWSTVDITECRELLDVSTTAFLRAR